MKNLIISAKIKSSHHLIVQVLFIAVLLAMPGLGAFAQVARPLAVSGAVVSESGEKLLGVNVVIRGTTIGTITDMDGRFILNVKNDDVLIVSFIGYEAQNVPVSGKTQFSVTLVEDTKNLEEVVIVGYGEVKRANLLGSVASMSAKEIEDIPVVSLSNLLEGRLAGVHVSPAQPSGNPGAQTRVRIRAETTFGTAGGAAKDPSALYIIDGFEVSQEEFDILDPSEIESISVLKDASAAVYGSKGANGVVLVKTKRGRVGKLQVSYSGSHGFNNATQLTEMMSAYDHARYNNARYRDEGTDKWEQVSGEELERLKGINYDWLDLAWQSSSTSRHTINVTGGNERVKYFGGGTYTYTGGNFPDLGIGKYSFRLGMDLKIVDGLTASITSSFDNRDYKRPSLAGEVDNTMQGLFQNLLQAPKWMPPYLDGKPVGNLGKNNLELFNSKSYQRDVDKGNTMNLKLAYEFQTIKGLQASLTYSRREGHGYNKQYQIPYNLYSFRKSDDSDLILSNNIESILLLQNNNRIVESYAFRHNYQFNATVSYANSFGLHKVSSFVTYEQGEADGYSFSARSNGMLIKGIETQRAFNYESALANGSMSESGRLASVGRINYSYDDKYLMEAAGRYEGTTLFAPGQRMGFFPSLAVGWVMSEESFMDNIQVINFMKWRVSAGITGSPSVGAYEYLLQYGPSGSYLFGDGTASGGLGVSGKTDVVSSGATWEKSKMLNYGVDMKIFDSKLGIAIDGFYTHQTDILDQRSSELPQTSGIIVMPSENIGELKAWGFDADLTYYGKVGKDFRYNIKGIFNFASNMILQRPTQYQSNDFRYPIGQSTFAAGREEGYYIDGIIRTQEQLDAINAMWREKWGFNYSVFGKPAEVGMYYFQDVGRPGISSNGEPQTVFEPDGLIDKVYDKTYVQRVNDRFVWKNLLPTSISLGASYKNFSMSMLFTMSYGITNKVVDKLARTGATPTENSPAFWSDFWTPENPNAEYPSPKFASDNELVNTYWMKDVKRLRLNSMNLSYNMPKQLSMRWNIPEMRLFISGRNLWTPISTFDYKEDAIARYNTYPLMREINLGVNVKF